VSSDGQVDGYGLAAQERAVKAWAKPNRHRPSHRGALLGTPVATPGTPDRGFRRTTLSWTFLVRSKRFELPTF